MRAAEKMSGLQLSFKLIIELLKICTGNNVETQNSLPLSPALRSEVRKLDRYIEDYKLLCDFKIETHQELSAFKEDIQDKISQLEQQRYALRLKIRRVKTPEEELDLKNRCKELTKEITPLRQRLKIAERIEAHSLEAEKLLESERKLESETAKTKTRDYER